MKVARSNHRGPSMPAMRTGTRPRSPGIVPVTSTPQAPSGRSAAMPFCARSDSASEARTSSQMPSLRGAA